MSRNFLEPESHHREIDLRTVWFQQDGATAHTARTSMWVLREMIPGHVISRGGDMPACSPDLSVCDNFLWGYLKPKIYLTKPCDIDKLRNAIKEDITAIPDNMVRKAMSTLHGRLEQFRRGGGKCVRDVLFKK
jgi:hypothetical protein